MMQKAVLIKAEEDLKKRAAKDAAQRRNSVTGQGHTYNVDKHGKAVYVGDIAAELGINKGRKGERRATNRRMSTGDLRRPSQRAAGGQGRALRTSTDGSAESAPAAMDGAGGNGGNGNGRRMERSYTLSRVLSDPALIQYIDRLTKFYEHYAPARLRTVGTHTWTPFLACMM